MDFEEVYNNFLIYASKRHKKQGLYTITQNFNLHVLPYFKNKKVSDLTIFDILNWQNDILSKNYSNKYNSVLYYVFNSFMNYCVLCSYINENIVSQVGSFKKRIECKNHKIYNIWQFRWFRFNLNNFVIKQYFSFMYFYGTRPGETMALRFCDLSFLRVSINHNLQRKGSRDLDTPKNQSSFRTFSISLLMFLRILSLKRYYILKFGYCNNDFFIFGGLKPLSPTTIDRYKLNACKKSKLYAITQHEFRHSFATRMIRKKKSIVDVSHNMGHSTISMTLDVYTH